MKSNSTLQSTRHLLTCLRVLVLIAGIGMTLMALPARQAFAGTVTYKDTDNKKELDNPSNTYVIQGDGKLHKDDNHFTVPRDSSSKGTPFALRSKT